MVHAKMASVAGVSLRRCVFRGDPPSTDPLLRLDIENDFGEATRVDPQGPSAEASSRDSGVLFGEPWTLVTAA